MKRFMKISGGAITAALFRAVIGTAIIGLFPACKQETKPVAAKSPTISLENLQTAYTVSVKRQRMYDLFIPRAEKEKNKGVAMLFKALSFSEGIHAQAHAELMKKFGATPVSPPVESVVVGSTLQTLKMALSSEELELNSMYPNLLRTATAEEFPQGVDLFNATMAVEDRHVELVRDAVNKNGAIGAVLFLVCPHCGYIITSKETPECPVCKASPTEFSKI